jgi:alpha-tubulin suppressor-like RCC1 family protein
MALSLQGTVWTWGLNRDGQLGDGTSGDAANKLSPVEIQGLTGVIGIAAGGTHSVALKDDGTVWTWGDNQFGQLGNASTQSVSSPQQVTALSNVIDIAAGYAHSVALCADGTVWAWGLNTNGQLGAGTTAQPAIPVEVIGLSNIREIGCGSSHCFAIDSTGSVWGWGNNDAGQLGDRSKVNQVHPVQIELEDIIAVTAGDRFSLFLDANGQVYSVGALDYLGRINVFPTEISEVNWLPGITMIDAGLSHSIALASDGTLWGWGYNFNGQVGDGTTESRQLPVSIPPF